MESLSAGNDDEVSQGKQRSYDAINTMYHEARQETELLHKQLRLKDSAIAELKARLARYERTYMTVGDKEPVVIGPSMSLLESLCKEICKHKQRRNELEAKATRHEEEILKLTAELKEKEQELERVRSEPGHEKDQQIETLRTALQEKERAEATRTILCTSLAEEADQLRRQLGATVKVCKELLARLEKDHKREGAEEAEQKEEEEQQNTDPAEMIQKLQQENQHLKQRVAYVQNLNSQWQKYDNSREDYIRGLCLRLRESSGPAAAVPGLGPVSSTMLHHEIARLNGLLEGKISECVRLSREAEDVKRQDRERIQMLKQQVLIYTEDFKSERADRERAQGQIQDMKEQIRQLKQLLHKQQGAARENRDRDLVPLCRVHIGHRVAPRRTKDTEPVVRGSSDRQQQAANGAAAPQSPQWNERELDLRCPCCQARFHETDAVRYFEHWEECAKL